MFRFNISKIKNISERSYACENWVLLSVWKKKREEKYNVIRKKEKNVNQVELENKEKRKKNVRSKERKGK